MTDIIISQWRVTRFAVCKAAMLRK